MILTIDTGLFIRLLLILPLPLMVLTLVRHIIVENIEHRSYRKIQNACREGNVEKLKKIHKRGLNIKSCNENFNNSPLGIAYEHNNIELALFLLSNKKTKNRYKVEYFIPGILKLIVREDNLVFLKSIHNYVKDNINKNKQALIQELSDNDNINKYEILDCFISDESFLLNLLSDYLKNTEKYCSSQHIIEYILINNKIPKSQKFSDVYKRLSVLQSFNTIFLFKSLDEKLIINEKKEKRVNKI